jgi:hypothetical protein
MLKRISESKENKMGGSVISNLYQILLKWKKMVGHVTGKIENSEVRAKFRFSNIKGRIRLEHLIVDN